MLTISESFNIIRDKDYSISVLNDKFYGGIIFKSGDYYYGIYCNGSNGKENCILNSMKEVVNYLEDIKEDWDYSTFVTVILTSQMMYIIGYLYLSNENRR